MPVTYATAAGSAATLPAAGRGDKQPSSTAFISNQTTGSNKRTRSPRQAPPQGAAEETVYILTLQTDAQMHQRMTSLRSKYFPSAINKLDAHLTLFHALPESKLGTTVIPTIEAVASKTQPFAIKATKPFRLSKGIAIGVSKPQGGEQGQAVHHALQESWLEGGFLTEQDAGGCRLHYTIMNKVDDAGTVDKALVEVQQSFAGYRGSAIGLGLWKYDKGWWRWERMFPFAAK